MNDHDHLNLWLLRLYLFLAATAGSVTGALVDKKADWQARTSAFFIGLSAAIFVGPLLLTKFAPTVSITSPEAVGFFYLFATCANSVLPVVIRKARELVGTFGKGENA